MADSTLAILVIAILISIGLWLSMRVVELVDVQAAVERLPPRLRRRVHWWQSNAIHVQLICAVIAVGTLCAQFGSGLS
jgi:TRAP-type C4-dicarboxylate transport system permease small subunit